MTKLADLPKEERETLQTECWSKADQISRAHEKRATGFGICSCCINMRSARTQYAIVRAFCIPMQLLLTNEHPIEECSYYTEKGQLSLEEMYSMAYYIEVKKPIGFESEDRKDD